jgi:hypothetical protein
MSRSIKDLFVAPSARVPRGSASSYMGFCLLDILQGTWAVNRMIGQNTLVAGFGAHRMSLVRTNVNTTLTICSPNVLSPDDSTVLTSLTY